MQVLLNIDSEELIEAVQKMPLEEKLKLYDKIKEDIMQSRFELIRNELEGTVTLSITHEVEHVRTER